MQAQIDAMTAELVALQEASNNATTIEDIARLQAEIEALQATLDALTAQAPVLGSNHIWGKHSLRRFR